MTPGEPIVGIVAALPDEARCLGVTGARFGGSVPIGDSVLVHIAGMGAANAHTAAKALVNEGATALVSWGFAGALAPQLLPGAVVVPTRIIDTQNRAYAVTADWSDRLRRTLTNNTDITLQTGTMLTCTSTIQSSTEKRNLRQAFQAVAADMEGAAIAAVAQEAGLPFIVIRSISDSAHMCLPSTVLSMIDTNGRLHPFQGLLQLLRHPRQTPALLNVARGARQARCSLRIVFEVTAPRLLVRDDFAFKDRGPPPCPEGT